MNLHKDNNAFRQAIQFTSDTMQIPAIYIEKDYWVTYALYKINNGAVAEDVIFKGGTALSKCYGIIERFSEDIDLVVLRREGETDSKLKSKLKEISQSIIDELPEIEITGVTRKMGMNRKTAHTYSKKFTGIFGQVRDVIILESSWLGYYEPFNNKSISSFIAEVLKKTKQEALIKEYGLAPFEMKVLETTRTICEKIMSLVRFSYTSSPIQDLKNKIRHTYDIHQLLQQAEFKNYINSANFSEMLLKVAKDDIESFRNNNSWLSHHPNESLFFNQLDTLWRTDLREIYSKDFKNLVYGKLPDEAEVLKSLLLLKERMSKIEWNVKLE